MNSVIMACQYRNQYRTSSEPKHGKKLARATVELYSTHYGAPNWILLDTGFIYLMKSHDRYYMILSSKSKSHVVWQCEMHRSVYYTVNLPYFHIIAINDALYGINFSDLTEAEIFYNAVDRLWRFQNWSKILSSFTSRFTNFFVKKTIPPLPVTNREPINQKCIMPKSQSYPNKTTPRKVITPPPIKQYKNGDHSIFKKLTPAPIKRSQKRNIYCDEVAYNYNVHKMAAYNNQHGHEYIPQPPPLPPPPDFLHLPANKQRSDERNYYDLSHHDCTDSSDLDNRKPTQSFKYQIKQEARRRHPSRQNLLKYLP